ncbi:unnamed protein product [Phytomonas sp. EM1]|nr:unnamed protein product [Phytomonas sp. EM1]|eukprot:CCW61959.1 unnamed protein product [Phytomonas sp. isolate EM1]
MQNSSTNESGNGTLPCGSNLEETIRNIKRANSGISEFYGKFSKYPPQQTNENENSIKEEVISLSIDEGSAFESSNSPPGKPFEQEEPAKQAEHVEYVVSRRRIGIFQRRINLCYFIWLKLIYAYDSGAFSAAVGVENGIVDEWKVTTTQQGALISSVFLGSVFGSAFSAHLFSIYDQRRVLLLSMIFHTLATFSFTAFPFFYLALVNRFLLGITLSFIVVYVPVWVEEFAPKCRESIWMGLHNVAVPIGIIFGYLMCAYFTLRVQIGWECAFFAKCLFMLPTLLLLWRIDPESINVGRVSTTQNDTDPTKANILELPGDPSADINTYDAATRSSRFDRIRNYIFQRIGLIWEVVRPLLYNTVFMLNMFILCMMFFVVTGLQNFLTQYLREDPFNASMTTITIGFGISVLTAPVLGVLVGAVALDLCGGYSDDLFRVGIFGLCWSIPGSIFSTICIFISNPVSFIVFLALLLFCGGAIVPFATGLTMSSLPENLRPAGAAFSQIVYNLLGNFSGPMVCSVVADLSGGLKYGIMTLLLSTNVGVILVAVLFFISTKNRINKNSTSSEVVVTCNTDDVSHDTAFNPSSSEVNA